MTAPPWGWARKKTGTHKFRSITEAVAAVNAATTETDLSKAINRCPRKGRGYAPTLARAIAARRAHFHAQLAPIEDAGYRDCACRDCFEIAIGAEGAMCHGCEAAGCELYAECQRPDAYGCDDAPQAEDEPTPPSQQRRD